MRAISTDLKAHLQEETTTLATCWRVQRRDGAVIALTTHDRDLRVGGLRYRADGGLTPTAIAESGDLAVDNLEIDGILSSGGIRETDLATGRFDGARISIFLVDWTAPDGGTLEVKRGTLGRVIREDGQFRAELRGLSHALRRQATEVFSPACRAELGDHRCKRALVDFERVLEVTAGMDAVRFDTALAEADGWADFGRLRWHSGGNGGLVSEVRRQVGGRLTLFAPPPKPIAAGDIFTLTAGCAKTVAACRDRFGNLVNFRGEPTLPGTDAILDYPGLR